MKIPVTGNPDIDAATVKAALAALEARERAEAGVDTLRQHLTDLRGWARRKRATLTRKVKTIIHDIKERTA